jgi:hypothetical protein
MIEANFDAISSAMSGRHAHRGHERFQLDSSTLEWGRIWGRMNLEPSGQENKVARDVEFDDDDGHRCGCRHGHEKFGDVIGAAIFAHRQRMEQRAEFRAEMQDIRSGIHDLMGEVEGGVLSQEQQQQFDGFVQEIVELRESYDFRHWRTTDADLISARILHRFGVDPAPCGCPDVPHGEAAAQTTDAGQTAVEENQGSEPAAGTVETEPEHPVETIEETEATIEEVSDMTETAAAAETGAVDTAAETESDPNAELMAIAEKLASSIADASALMDDLLEALGA